MVKKIERYEMDMQELEQITERVYGVGYDIQMGERSQGTVLTYDTRQLDSIQAYWTGLKPNHYGGVDGNSYENAKCVDLTDEEALLRWRIRGTGGDIRPFNKIDENGEYLWEQPDADLVLQDLANRGEIPHGEYQIRIDW